jgi:hypothetical protein
MELKETLNERGSRYGSYSDVIEARSRIMEILTQHNERSGLELLNNKFYIAMNDIVLKLVRASASPNYKDSWHDIQGYAHLIETELCENETK